MAPRVLISDALSQAAVQIFKDLQDVCAPFGTTVTVANGVGVLNWK